MIRRVLLPSLVFSTLLGVFVLTGLRADEPTKAKADAEPAAGQDEAALNQQILARKYRDFEAMLLQLAQRMEKSSRPEERERAAILKQALEKAASANINNKFDKLINTLKSSKSSTLQDIQQAMAQNKTLAEDLQTILDLLRTQNRDELLKAEKIRLENLIKMLDRAIVEQKNARAVTEAGKTSKEALARQQKKVTQYTETIAKAMGKKDAKETKPPGEPKEAKPGDPKEGKPGDPKEAKPGDPKEGKPGEPKESKPGDPKEGKPGDPKEGKPGSPKEGKPGDPKPGQPGQPGQDSPPSPPQDEEATSRKQVQDAIDGQKRAEDQIDKKKNDEASKSQDEVVRNLEQARKKLEDILKQIREEEKAAILAALQQRCEQMLQMQIAVRDDTGRLNDDIVGNLDRKPNRANEQKSLTLSKREDQIVNEANKAIQLLEAEGSAVAFPEVFHQVRDDMKNVARRLLGADAGVVTQAIEDDIIASLKDMIEALKKAQQDLKDKKPPPPNQPPPSGPNPLLDAIAELKMIRAMQIRINTRTVTYAREYEGEQLPLSQNPADQLKRDQVGRIQKELKELSERQQKIYDVVRNIATGTNR